MIRTAEEWIDEVTFIKDGLISVEAAAKAINEARKEIVKECAEVAAINGEWITNDLGEEVQIFGTLDKQSILKLIDQIK